MASTLKAKLNERVSAYDIKWAATNAPLHDFIVQYINERLMEAAAAGCRHVHIQVHELRAALPVEEIRALFESLSSGDDRERLIEGLKEYYANECIGPVHIDSIFDRASAIGLHWDSSPARFTPSPGSGRPQLDKQKHALPGSFGYTPATPMNPYQITVCRQRMYIVRYQVHFDTRRRSRRTRSRGYCSFLNA